MYIWPIPKSLPNMGVFENITTPEKFNEILGNKDNWNKIDKELYEKWILPQAIILFGKTWFNGIKNGKPVHKKYQFYIFEKHCFNVEDSTIGKAVIAKIIDKVSSSLNIYLEGKWHQISPNRKPGGYIINSIKHDFIKDISNELGFKRRKILICPFCLYKKKKVPLIKIGEFNYNCPNCTYIVNSTQNIEGNKYDLHKKFQNFVGISCICPSKKCGGKFIPINFMEQEEVLLNFIKTKNKHMPRSIKNFTMPPEEMLSFSITCPFCSTNFTINEALKAKSGFKNLSGFLTGLPFVMILEKRNLELLDEKMGPTIEVSYKDNIIDSKGGFFSEIEIKQKLNILIEEIILYMAQLKKEHYTGLLMWYFLNSLIKWIVRYQQDAFKYFFEDIEYDKNHNIRFLRKQEVDVHISIFNMWMIMLEKHIAEFTKINNNIKELKDFKWFCHLPKFTGPEYKFKSIVNKEMKIKSEIGVESKYKPRIVKIISIKKINDVNNYVEDIEEQKWQYIKIINNSNLRPNDEVEVEALFMPGHPTHSPIQKMIRFKKSVLMPIIEKIKKEEDEEICDVEFWKNRKIEIENAKRTVNLKEE